MSGVQQRVVGADEGDQRLDRYVRKLFPHLSQGRIEKLCRKGEIRVDKGRVKSNSRVEVGQIVRIPPLPDAGTVEGQAVERAMSAADRALIRDAVIWQDEHIIAINKPPGLPTQGGTGVVRHVDALSAVLQGDHEDKPRLVHRLDKDTSGILLLARTRMAAKGLTENLKHFATRKIYWAVVAGVPDPRSGTIKYGLHKTGGHGRGGENEKMRCVHPREVDSTEGAKRATTDFATLTVLGRRASWQALVPITGRTHQLRAHMAEIGHPIMGDGKYGGSGQENLGDGWGASLGGDLSRKLHLHARTLIIEHPITKAQLTLHAPLPEHMQRTWDYVGWDVTHAPLDPFNMPD